MYYHFSKYTDVYQLRADIDESTGDYCRDISGELCNFSDIYIKCKNAKIYYYGKNICEVYFPNKAKGKNTLIKTYNTLISEDKKSFKQIKDELTKENIIISVFENDKELFIKINESNLEKLSEIFGIYKLKPSKTTNIIKKQSPFSKKLLKNRIKHEFYLTEEEGKKYKEIICGLDFKDISIISKTINEMYSKIKLTKEQKKCKLNHRNEAMKKGMKPIEYLKSCNVLEDFFIALEKNIGGLHGIKNQISR